MMLIGEGERTKRETVTYFTGKQTGSTYLTTVTAGPDVKSRVKEVAGFWGVEENMAILLHSVRNIA